MHKLEELSLAYFEIEDMVAKDPELLESGLKVLSRGFPTDAGPLGLLALDRNGVAVLIEGKSKDEGLQLLKTLRHYDYVSKNIVGISLLFKGVTKSQPRCIIVAPSFSQRFACACAYLAIDIQLKEYRVVKLPNGGMGVLMRDVKVNAFRNSLRNTAFNTKALKGGWLGLLDGLDECLSEISSISAELERKVELRKGQKVDEKEFSRFYAEAKKRFDLTKRVGLERYAEAKKGLLNAFEENESRFRNVVESFESILRKVAESFHEKGPGLEFQKEPLEEDKTKTENEAEVGKGKGGEGTVEPKLPSGGPLDLFEKTTVSCPNCGSGNPSNYFFCFRCGTRLKVEEFSSKETIGFLRKDMGTKNQPRTTTVKCPICGKENIPVARHCYNCNAILAPRRGYKETTRRG